MLVHIQLLQPIKQNNKYLYVCRVIFLLGCYNGNERRDNMKDTFKTLFQSFLYLIFGYLGVGILSTVLLFGLMLIGFGDLLSPLVVGIYYTGMMCILLLVYYLFLKMKNKLNKSFFMFNLIYTSIVCIGFTIIFWISKASLLNPLMNIAYGLVIPFLPVYIILSIFVGTYDIMIVIGSVIILSFILLILVYKKIKLLPLTCIHIVCVVCCLITFFTSPNFKYRNQGHDFEFLNGYSSTDLSDYTPYSNSGKLATLNHQADLLIEDTEEMPVLDGAEACYPVYSAIAKAIYKDIGNIEEGYVNKTKDENGRIVTFYNTAIGFERLVDGQVDMFFGAKPSASQLEYAKEKGVELVYTPIGKEAFVFFVNEKNPIDSLTSDQIKSIYHGDITNWKEVNGKDVEIIAYQRPERSGSQSMMTYFMGDVSLKEPLTYEMEMAMMGIIQEVAEYQNDKGAIGYSFRYFFEGLTQVDGAKMISVDGVYPSNESIQDGSYPIVTNLYCITVEGNDNENVEKVLDFLLSEDGQYLIEKTGYSPLK